MSLRLRITLLCACALAIPLAVAGTLAYTAERGALSGQLDSLLRSRAVQVTPSAVEILLGEHGLLPKQRERGAPAQPASQPSGQAASQPDAQPGAVTGNGPQITDLKLVTSSGTAASSAAAELIPVDPAAVAVASGRQPAAFRTVTTDGMPLRMYVFPAEPGVAGEVVAPLTPVQASLAELARELTVIGAGALFLVAMLTVALARRALRPVAALTQAAESVIQTGDLRQRVSVPGRGRDEIGRLAGTVNAMLGALEESVRAQRQLVADASHELGTPLTTLTVNLQLLDEPGGLEAGDAPELVRQARGQAEELTAMAGALVELARGGEIELHWDLVQLDLVAEAAAEHASRSPAASAVSIAVRASPCVVRGDADLLERAVGNLLDNAVKWSPAGGSVMLTVAGGEVTVTDEGPGIAAADLPFVFDRFYRSAAARGKPGSGLGLAIVRQVAELHGGTVSMENATRGAVARLRVPLLPAAGEATWHAGR